MSPHSQSEVANLKTRLLTAEQAAAVAETESSHVRTELRELRAEHLTNQDSEIAFRKTLQQEFQGAVDSLRDRTKDYLELCESFKEVHESNKERLDLINAFVQRTKDDQQQIGEMWQVIQLRDKQLEERNDQIQKFHQAVSLGTETLKSARQTRDALVAERRKFGDEAMGTIKGLKEVIGSYEKMPITEIMKERVELRKERDELLEERKGAQQEIKALANAVREQDEIIRKLREKAEPKRYWVYP